MSTETTIAAMNMAERAFAERDELRAENMRLRAALREPLLPADLCGLEGTPPDFYPRALISLAHQLGAANDFYYPLIGAAQILAAIENRS